MKPDIIEQNPLNLKTHRDNEQIKGHNVQFEWEEWQLEEYIKCANDPKYFARTYIKIINLDDGLVPFDLYPYQEKMYDTVQKERFSITLAARQAGKSIAFVIYLLWYAIFHSEKTVAIAANKLDTAMEMLSRIQLALENLPFFLQPGCKALNKKSIEFSNNSKIVARATSSNSLRGMSIHILYLDEFAFVERDEKFYTSTYPTITSGKKTKVIITSTPNGVGNVFYRLWRGAITKTNNFNPIKITWRDVPGRDEAWKKETIANTSERQFAQENEVEFLGSAKTLIDAEYLLSLQSVEPIFTKKEVQIYEKPKKDHHYVLVSDVAEGLDGDASAFSIIDVTSKPFIQVAAYANNKISAYLYPNIIKEFAKIYNNAFVCVESNDHGAVVNYCMVHDLEYDNIYSDQWKDRHQLGLKTTKKVKRLGCSNFKDLVEQGQLIIQDKETIDEICTFEEKGASFEAASGCHDDRVMSLVLFGYLASTKRFQNEFDIDLKDTLFSPDAIKQIQDAQLPPYPIADNHDGSEDVIAQFPETKFTRKERYEMAMRFKKDDMFGVVYENLNDLEEADPIGLPF